MAIHFDDNSLKQAIASGKPVVVDFWAPWCGPCKMIAPIIEQLAADYEGRVLIGKCDVDENTDMAAEFGVRNIPTILFFKDGELQKKRIVGSTTRDLIEPLVRDLL